MKDNLLLAALFLVVLGCMQRSCDTEYSVKCAEKGGRFEVHVLRSTCQPGERR